MKCQFTVLVCLLMFAACNSNKDLHTGPYKSMEVRWFEYPLKYMQGIRPFYSQGSHLFLRNDGQYEYITCANRIKGTWQQRGDSIHLHVVENKFRVDSLNTQGYNGIFPQTGWQFSFAIKKKKLISKSLDAKKNMWIHRLRLIENQKGPCPGPFPSQFY